MLPSSRRSAALQFFKIKKSKSRRERKIMPEANETVHQQDLIKSGERDRQKGWYDLSF